MICSVCGKAIEEVFDWPFFEGLAHLSRPKNYRVPREWVIIGPLYFHPTTHKPYCSPQCATKDLGHARDPKHNV